MKYLIIPKTNDWKFNSIASKWYPRTIKFRKGEEFSIVLASIYNKRGSNHRTPEAVLKKAKEWRRKGYSMFTIFHVSGVEFAIQEDKLVRVLGR